MEGGRSGGTPKNEMIEEYRWKTRGAGVTLDAKSCYMVIAQADRDVTVTKEEAWRLGRAQGALQRM